MSCKALYYTYSSGPVSNSEEVLREKWVSLEGVDGTMMPTVDSHYLLSRGLCLPVAADDCTLLCTHHKLSRLKQPKLNCSEFLKTVPNFKKADL